MKIRDVRLVNGVAKSVRVIGKGNKERSVPLPDAFGQVFGYWISDKGKDEFVFAKEFGGKPPGPPAARAYLRRLVEKTDLHAR
jgi:integrase/recombinase XerD